MVSRDHFWIYIIFSTQHNLVVDTHLKGCDVICLIYELNFFIKRHCMAQRVARHGTWRTLLENLLFGCWQQHRRGKEKPHTHFHCKEIVQKTCCCELPKKKFPKKSHSIEKIIFSTLVKMMITCCACNLVNDHLRISLILFFTHSYVCHFELFI